MHSQLPNTVRGVFAFPSKTGLQNHLERQCDNRECSEKFNKSIGFRVMSW
jgi:hypothetical protein